ncbi:MAG TPA: cobalt ECF transporter T component CbiQ [Methanoregulaceae archaeon]|nr:cobalt ECF transporter T component CbiQ [Methanoregulaceae archaeon]
MSTAAISEHLPDIDLITSYAERQDSVFSRVSPWTKFFLLILVVLTITLTRNLFILIALYGIIMFLFALAGLPVRKLVAWYTMPLVFVISLVGIMAWSEPGNAVISILFGSLVLTLTDNGIILVVTLILKALISITFSLFFLMTTRYEHFSSMIYRLFPDPLDQIFLMAYRFLFLTLAMTGSLLKAVRSRGGGLIHSLRIQGKLFAEIAGLVFIRSFERAERVHKAMIARGYSGGSYGARSAIPAPCPAEYCILAAATLAVLITGIMSHAGGALR